MFIKEVREVSYALNFSALKNPELFSSLLFYLLEITTVLTLPAAGTAHLHGLFTRLETLHSRIQTQPWAPEKVIPAFIDGSSSFLKIYLVQAKMAFGNEI